MSWLAVAVTTVSVGSQAYAGSKAKKAGKASAAQYREQAKARRGEGHYAAEEERRQARYLQSRARAVASASGSGGASVTRLLADIDAEGEYRALMRKYSADVEAKNLDASAEVARKGGNAAAAASYASAATTAFTQGSDIWERYKTPAGEGGS